MRNILCTIIIASFLTACSNFLSDYSQDLSKVETAADLNELLLGDAYLPVGFYEAYNYSAPQPYNTFIHTMSDEIQQNHSTNTRAINSMLSSEDIFGYFTWQRSVGINSLETAIGTENECWKRRTSISTPPTWFWTSWETSLPETNARRPTKSGLKAKAISCAHYTISRW